MDPHAIEYSDLLDRKAVAKIPTAERQRIQDAIEQRLVCHPDAYGEPLQSSLRGYRKFRVGDYRVIFRREGRTIKVFAIDHRSVVYERFLRKLGLT